MSVRNTAVTASIVLALAASLSLVSGCKSEPAPATSTAAAAQPEAAPVPLSPEEKKAQDDRDKFASNIAEELHAKVPALGVVCDLVVEAQSDKELADHPCL